MPGTARRLEGDGEMLARLGADGAKWAEEMHERVDEAARRMDPDCVTMDEARAYLWDPAPGGLLHVWLCNAIEAGRSAGYAAGRKDAAAEAPDVADELERLAREWPLPADSAGSPPADSAGSELPANPAGSEWAPILERHAAAAELAAAALEKLAVLFDGLSARDRNGNLELVVRTRTDVTR